MFVSLISTQPQTRKLYVSISLSISAYYVNGDLYPATLSLVIAFARGSMNAVLHVYTKEPPIHLMRREIEQGIEKGAPFFHETASVSSRDV
jgi:hypothetical protein